MIFKSVFILFASCAWANPTDPETVVVDKALEMTIENIELMEKIFPERSQPNYPYIFELFRREGIVTVNIGEKLKINIDEWYMSCPENAQCRYRITKFRDSSYMEVTYLDIDNEQCVTVNTKRLDSIKGQLLDESFEMKLKDSELKELNAIFLDPYPVRKTYSSELDKKYGSYYGTIIVEKICNKGHYEWSIRSLNTPTSANIKLLMTLNAIFQNNN